MSLDLFDSVVANAGRLSILTSLAVDERQEFVRLRERTHLTDGNLASHAKRLAAAGLIGIDKSFRDGKPVTRLSLTPAGRSALESHARRVLAAISHRRISFRPAAVTEEIIEAPPPAVERAPAKTFAPVVVDSSDDWVD